MTRNFLKELGLEEDLIDKILDENFKDVGREKTKAENVKTELADLREQLTAEKGKVEELTKAGNVEDVRKELEALQAKYDTDIAERDNKLNEWSFNDAVGKAITESKLKFSSNMAKNAFVSALKAQKLELKDGKFEGLDEFVKAQKEADPAAFVAEGKPVARIVDRTGSGGTPAGTMSRAAEIAAQMNANLYGAPTKQKE